MMIKVAWSEGCGGSKKEKHKEEEEAVLRAE